MTRIIEDDVLGAGRKQIIVKNDKLKVIIVPEVGGRIAEIQFDEMQFLHRTYPRGVKFGTYTEYGGIEECIGSAPGNLWNASWQQEIKDNGVLLQVMSRAILVRKFISLDESLPVVKIKYDFFNTGNTMTKFTFSIHPEISINGVFKDNRYYIPSRDGIIQGIGESVGFKKSVPSPELWCSVSNDKYTFGQMFPKDVVDSIEIYYPRANTHLVIQPMILGVGIAPDMRSSFMYMIYAGEGDEKRVEEIRNFLDSEFSVEYEKFSKDEIPDKVLKTKITVPSVDTGIVFGAETMRLDDMIGNVQRTVRIPNIPPDINKIIKTNTEKIAKEIKQFQKVQKGFQAEMAKMAMPRRPQMEKQAELIVNKIEINHLNGNISINSYDEDHIGYSINGILRRENNIAKFKTTDDLSLDIPEDITDIDIKTVNGDIMIDDISANLSILAVSGEANIKMKKLVEDGFIEISFVSGDINLKIPANSSCTISAGTVNGEVSTDLPIEEEKRMPNYIKGKLGDGTAKILLRVISGNININGY